MQIVFHRFNAGDKWGLGHLYRNITLMKELRNRHVLCIGVINDFAIAKEMLSREGFQFCLISEKEDPSELISVVMKFIRDVPLHNSVVFWDRLDSTKEYINVIRNAHIKIITYGNYDSSALLANEVVVSREALVGGYEICYSGPSYQILNDDVIHYSNRRKKIKKFPQQVLLHFGGTDPHQLLTLSFEVLNDIANIIFIIIDGKAQNNRAIEEVCAIKPNFWYFPSVNNFAELLYNSDMCILAGGVSMFEASAIGTPMINICQNDDQNVAAEIFHNRVDSVNLGIVKYNTRQTLRKAFEQMCNDQEWRTRISFKMKQYVDADGTKRVADIVQSVLKSS